LNEVAIEEEAAAHQLIEQGNPAKVGYNELCKMIKADVKK
jgi:hypothetical protein